MPDSKPSFLRGLLGRIGDKVVWGDNYNRQTGQWTSTPGQVIGGVGSRVLNAFVPGAGTLTNMVGNGYYGQGPAARFFDHGPGEITRQTFPYTGSVNVPNIGATGGVMPPQLPSGGGEQPWTGSIAGTNPFGGQYGGNLGLPTMPAVNARQIGGNLSFGGGHVNNGVGAGTGYGAGSIMNDAWGNAAAGFGVGAASHGSGGNFALMDAMSQNKRNRV